jgi:hypothetical protein
MDTAHKLSRSFCLNLGTNFYFFHNYRVLRKTLSRLCRHPRPFLGFRDRVGNRCCTLECATAVLVVALPYYSRRCCRSASLHQSTLPTNQGHKLSGEQSAHVSVCGHLTTHHRTQWHERTSDSVLTIRRATPPARQPALLGTWCLPSTECDGCCLDGRITCNRFCHAKVP